MNDFIFFFKQGLSHISDLGAYDHILFIAALAAAYHIKNGKNLILLVTAFTVGHSIALALATLKIVNVNSGLIEFLIPVTIIATCFATIIQKIKPKIAPPESTKVVDSSQKEVFHVEQKLFTYLIIIGFGIIHGLGFSSYLRFILSENESLFTPLLAFNLGLELGQIFILTIALIINFVLLRYFKISQKTLPIIISILIIIISIPILLDTGNALFFEH
jgi:hypothetical protein